MMRWIPTIGLCLVLSLATAYAGERRGEYEVKLAFIYNFAKFIDWPQGTLADSEEPIVLCVTDRSTLGKAIGTIEGKPIKGHLLRVREILNADEISACQIIFIVNGEHRSGAKILDACQGNPILTISENSGSPGRGASGMINFVVIDDKIRFEISQKNAQKEGFIMSSNLLKLAYRITE